MLKCFPWLVGSKKPFTVSLNKEEVALCSLAWPHFLCSHLCSWKYLPKVHVHTVRTSQAFAGSDWLAC